MVSAPVDLSIVLPAYNEAGNIAPMIAALKRVAAPLGRVEIVVVDSGSTDGTVAIAKRWCDRLIEIPEESFTYGYSANLGAEAASALESEPLDLGEISEPVGFDVE